MGKISSTCGSRKIRIAVLLLAWSITFRFFDLIIFG